MKILEVRDGFIKFETDNSVYLSSFVQIMGTEKNYVAQIIQIKHSGNNSIAYAKILFLYDGTLLPYDKTLPSSDSEIKKFTFNILNNSINAATPVIIGETPEEGINIIVDESAFNKKMLMSIDSKDANNMIVKNLVKQFNNIGKKVLIIDTLGIIEANKYKAGFDFKLPLNTDSLAFMYEDCLNDATADSKSLIIEIFKDLSDYSQTIPFVPFGSLKSIVDEMVDKSHIFKLLVLKNKLAKFDKLGYFAKDKKEVDRLDAILNSKCAIIDLSKLDSAFQSRYLSFLYEKLKDKNDTQVILELSNTVSKKNLKEILSSENISTTFITHSQFKYLNDIKNLFDNFIITPSVANNEIFKVYGTFLNAMKDGTYFITGEAVNYIPLVSSLKQIDEVIPAYTVQKEIVQEIINNEEIIEDASLKIEEEICISDETERTDEADDEILGELSTSNDENLEIEAAAAAAEEEEEEEEEETPEPEIVEEKVISNEEILSSIEEKSNAVITEAANSIETPPENMFNIEEDEDEVEDEYEEIKEIDEYFEPVEYSEEILEELTFEQSTETADNTIEEQENDNELSIEEAELVENVEEEDFIDISEEISETSLTDTKYETLETTENEVSENDLIEELPLIESTEEFVDEIPDTQENTFDESELETKLASNLENIQIKNIDDNLLAENEEIEVPEGIDIESANLTDEQEFDSETQDGETGDETINILPISEDYSDFEELVELDPNETDENDIVIDIEDTDLIIPNEDEIVKDVDKVFTTRKEDDLSDSDLDLIDELNNDEDVLLEKASSEGSEILEELEKSDNDSGILEEPQNDEILETRNTSTPIVPVYDAEIPQEDLVMSDPIAQGDTVTHAKYGSGVVEKMIKYGNKTLFSINFDNIGRRLLDPTLTEIKKA